MAFIPEFCPKCKKVMVRKENKLVCPKCGCVMERSSKESYVSVIKQVNRDVPVLESNISLQPTTNAKCPACENNLAYWEMKQTRKADEPPTLFLTCTKCGNRWRKY
jgi:DNA-directed RNA polymerase subunit M